MVSREEVRAWLSHWRDDYLSRCEIDASTGAPSIWPRRLACAEAALAALEDAERLDTLDRWVGTDFTFGGDGQECEDVKDWYWHRRGEPVRAMIDRIEGET